MSWFRLDDQGAFHAKVIAAGNEAYGAWCRAGQWSSYHGTEGKIPRATALTIAKQKIWERLVVAGLCESQGDDGWLIHDFLDYNPSAEEVRSKRESRAEAGRRGGHAKAQANRKQTSGKALAIAKDNPGKPLANAWQNSAPIPIPIPIPDQEKEDPPKAPQRAGVEIGSARCERMCEVYLEALGEAGWTRSPLRERWERQALCDAINAHLASDGTVEATIAELRRAVAEWVAEHAAKPGLTSGWAPRRFKDWLAEGRPSGKRLTGSGQHPPPRDPKARPGPTSAEETASEPVTPEEQAAFEERLRNPRRPKAPVTALPGSMLDDATPADLEAAKRRLEEAKLRIAAKGAEWLANADDASRRVS